MDLKNATAVVTGGTGTIGGEIVDWLERAGARAVRWDRDAEDSAVVHCDVSSPESVVAAMEETVRRFGSPRVLVNVAGLSGGLGKRAAEAQTDAEWSAVLSSPASWESVLAVNVLGVVNTSREFGRVVARDGGAPAAIINITSISGGAIADPALAAYSTSKAAVHMVTRVTAADFGPLGITVNAVAPGFMETRMKPMPGAAPEGAASSAASASRTAGNDTAERIARATPLGRRNGQPADIAQATLALLAADFVTGQVVAVDGGLTQRSLTTM